MKSIPSPKISKGLSGLFYGHTAEMIKITKPLGVPPGLGLHLKKTDWYKETNSKTIKLRFINRSIVVTSDQKIIKEVFGNQNSFTNSLTFKTIFGYFFPNSIIVVENPQWSRIRKIIQRAITQQSLNPIVKTMCEILRKIGENDTINMPDTSELFSRITFDAFHQIMYNWNPKSVLNDPQSLKILENCNIISKAIGMRRTASYPLLWKLPTKQNLNANQSKKIIRDFVKEFVENRRVEIKKNSQSSNPNTSLVDLMIIASENEEGGLTNDELFDQISSIFFGAFDTTTNTLRFLFNYLSRYPEKQEKLRNEILKNFKSLEEMEKCDFELINQIKYLDNFINESQRICPLFPMIARTALESIKIGDYFIQKGTQVILDSHSIGFQPESWNGMNDLKEFRPERWDEHKPGKLDNALGFGFGGRICPGRKTALASIKTLICAVLLNYNVSLRNPNESFELKSDVGLSLKDGNGNIIFKKL